MGDLEVLLVGLGLLLLLVGLWRALRGHPSEAGRTAEDDERPPSSPPSGPSLSPLPPSTEAQSAAPLSAREMGLPRLYDEEDTLELDLTRLSIPSVADDDDAVTERRQPAVLPIVYDSEAAEDAPTGADACILVHAVGQTDRGRKRRKNEDRYLVLDRPPIFVVADGMGGYAGGEIASELAVQAIADAFAHASFEEPSFTGVPRRGAEVVQAVRRANEIVYQHAKEDPRLEGMGTTLVCARFSPKKQRLYVGHVGDSRCYVLRGGSFEQVTTDHTVEQEGGISGPLGATLTRALGVEPAVTVDLILGKPMPGDRYLLCSDGLNKMVSEEDIRMLLESYDDPAESVDALVKAANEEGGRDNITVIVVHVDPPPTMLASKGKRATNALLLMALQACTPPPPSGPSPVVEVPAERSLCGWEELSDAERIVALDSQGSALRPVAPGAYAAAIVAPDEAAFGDVASTLKRADADLVRIKLAVDERWLVPVTRYGGAPVTPKPVSTAEVETVVGHRRVIRHKERPRVRLADLRVHADAQVEVYVENEKLTGKRLAIDELKSFLTAVSPPVGAFTIHADDDVRWANFVRTAAAAACYDRSPGFEPHEVIWDQRGLAPPHGG